MHWRRKCVSFRQYLEFLEAIKDSSHPQYKLFAEWGLLDFAPTSFDIQEVNKGLVYCDE